MISTSSPRCSRASSSDRSSSAVVPMGTPWYDTSPRSRDPRRNDRQVRWTQIRPTLHLARPAHHRRLAGPQRWRRSHSAHSWDLSSEKDWRPRCPTATLEGAPGSTSAWLFAPESDGAWGAAQGLAPASESEAALALGSVWGSEWASE